MIRRNSKQVGRALGDWLRRHRGERVTIATPTGPGEVAKASPTMTARGARLRRLFAATRVTPYQLRRDWQW